MPQNIFNLYSSTVFADHPLALWNLDDDFSYLSLISASPVWNIVGGSSASVAVGPKTKPGETVGVSDSDITYQTFAGSSSAMTMKAQSFYSPGNLDLTKQSVCVSTFIYPYDNDVTSCEIGFEYIDPGTSQTIKKSKTYTSITEDQWKKIEYSTNLSLWSASASNVTIYPYLQITFSNSPITRNFSLYNFAVGQWSEQYNAETVGSITTPLSSLSASAGIIQSIGGIYSSSPSYIKTVPIDAYSLSDADTGYYIIEGNKMLATNSKLPMVYGSGNITEIYPSSFGTPSIIIPGKGFLHQNGKYRNLTLEFWIRINVETKTKTRIVGPLSSKDGLYVHDGYFTLKIGPYEQSYFVSKWYTPSIINITYSSTFVTFMINGETVMSITLDPEDITFPNSAVYNRDWIGFYATENTQPFEIDCIAIYPYIVPDQLVKRKFIYGQGVGKSEDIVKRFSGNLTNIDFSFSNYTNNIIYPDMSQWSNGFYSNIDVDSKFIGLPIYDLPEIVYLGDNLSIFSIERFKRTWFGVKAGGTWRKWLQTIWQSLAQSRESDPLFDNIFTQIDTNEIKHITLKPNLSYENIYGSIVFPSTNILNDPTKSIFGIFSINSSELAQAQNDANIEEMTIMHFKNRSTGDIFKIIIDINSNKLVYKFNTVTLKEFSLNITNDDLVFVAGINIDQVSLSYANIIRNFFFNPDNLIFSVGGNEKNMFTGKIYKVTANNKFFTINETSEWFDDEGISSISNLPTTTLSSNCSKYIGNYTMLFKETNATMIMDIGSRGYWEDSIPLTTFASYVKDAKGNPSIYDLDLIQFNIDYPKNIYIGDQIDTSNDSVSSYITLKTYQDISTVNYSDYTITKELNGERVIDFDEVTTNIDITKFRLVDGTIIFTPKSLVDFKDAYVTIHIELQTYGTRSEPIIVKEMSLASLAFDERSLYELGSLNGNAIYPFSREKDIYLTKSKNPIIFYKQSMPYLFLTGDSGVYVLPYSNVDNTTLETFYRGISFPINPNKLTTYNLYGLHFWTSYNMSKSFDSRIKIMSIKVNNLDLIFYLDPIDNGKRAKISVYEITIADEIPYTNILMYQNGILLDSPYIYPMSWSLITFSFPTPLASDSYIGQIEIYQGCIFNNISMYEASIDKKVDDIFESHLGLSSIVAQDESTLFINSESTNIYTDIKWTTFIGKPV